MIHQTAMQASTPHPLMGQARAECDRRGITDEDGLRQVLGNLAYKQFLQESKYWRDQALTLYQAAFPVTMLHSDGTPTQTYQFSEQEQELLRTIDAAIAEISKKYQVT